MVAYRAFALALLVAVSASCKSESSHPPLYQGGTSTGPVPDNPVDCAALRDAGSALTEQGPGTLSDDGGVLGCFANGTECPLIDVDGGICDGGADAAVPVATCSRAEWMAGCVPWDASAP